MSDKTVINGKEYTERTIEYMEIDGIRTTGNSTISVEGKPDATVKTIIKLDNVTIQANSIEEQVQVSVNNDDINVASNIEENNSLISKIILFIKNLF